MLAIEKYLNPAEDDYALLDKKKRIVECIILTKCYYQFSLMQLHRSASQQKNPTFEEAERGASLFNALLGVNMKPSDFIKDHDKEANESICYYEEFKMWVDLLEGMGYDSESVLAFCKQIEYGYVPGLYCFKAECYFHYSVYVEVILHYFSGNYALSDLQNSFCEFSIFSKKLKPASRDRVVRFIKYMLRIHKLFHSIVLKRKTRAFIKSHKFQ